MALKGAAHDLKVGWVVQGRCVSRSGVGPVRRSRPIGLRSQVAPGLQNGSLLCMDLVMFSRSQSRYRRDCAPAQDEAIHAEVHSIVNSCIRAYLFADDDAGRNDGDKSETSSIDNDPCSVGSGGSFETAVCGHLGIFYKVNKLTFRPNRSEREPALWLPYECSPQPQTLGHG